MRLILYSLKPVLLDLHIRIFLMHMGYGNKVQVGVFLSPNDHRIISSLNNSPKPLGDIYRAP